MLKKIRQFIDQGKNHKVQNDKRHRPYVVPIEQHKLSRKAISGYALRVMKKLHQEKYDAYLVGGCVRDMLLGKHPKDFDVVTNAKPKEIRRLFRNSYLVGRRFQLVHVKFGSEIVEVATYRSMEAKGDENGIHHHAEHGMILRDNVFGTIEDDALRRDFTINALYYNFADSSIVDYVDGMADIRQKLIRLIGEPERRFREDPLRMVRALRFAAKLDCQLDPAVAEGIRHQKQLIIHVPPARLFDETMKIYRSGHAQQTFHLLQEYQLLTSLFPPLANSLQGKNKQAVKQFVDEALANTDLRVREGKSLSAAFLFASLLWWPLQETLTALQSAGKKLFLALEEAMEQVLTEQFSSITIPKRFTGMMRHIWLLQYQLLQRRGKRAYRCYYHPQFRAAYDFLKLRAQTGEAVQALADWWTEFQHVDEFEQENMIAQLQNNLKS